MGWSAGGGANRGVERRAQHGTGTSQDLAGIRMLPHMDSEGKDFYDCPARVAIVFASGRLW